MVSKGVKSSELSMEHLVKTFYLFIFEAKSKDLTDLVERTTFWI